jgi:hypothetical protein
MLFFAAGLTVCQRLVLVHPAARHDAGLLAHEMVHVEQMRRDGTLRFLWRYLTSRRHRLGYEVEAYWVSVRHAPHGLERFARALAHGYWLGIRVQDALALLAAPGASSEPSEHPQA